MNPDHPPASERDPIALALTVLPLAVLAGVAVVSAAVLGVSLLQTGAASPAAAANAAGGGPGIDLGSPAAILLLAGTFGGPAVAAATAFVLLAPIENFYRRGMLAVVCAFATVVGMLLCFPAHGFFGSAGLAALLFLCVIGAAMLGRRVLRLTR